MPEKWTGRLIGEMHNYGVTYDELAAELGVTKSYVSMILNGSRKPSGIRKRMEAAVKEVVSKKKSGCTGPIDYRPSKEVGTQST